MTTVLGRDFRSTFAAQFAGRLYAATFTKFTPGTVDSSDAAAGTNPTAAVYACDAIAFGYKERDIDGTLVKKGDYKVTITLDSIASVISDATSATLAMSGVTSHVDAVVQAREPGAFGNALTIELVPDASSPAGAIVEVGTNVKLRYQSGVTTEAQLEALISQSAQIYVVTPGTPGHILDLTDRLASTPLAGGNDNSVTAADVVPNPSDTITVPPPGETVAKTGRIIDISSITQATVTVQVRSGAID
jgi:hypothetical protein